jgi:uncharacterized membrane protein
MISQSTSTTPSPDSAEGVFFFSACLSVVVYFFVFDRDSFANDYSSASFLAFSLAMLLSVINFRGWKLIVMTLGEGKSGTDRSVLMQALLLLLGLQLKILSFLGGIYFLLNSGKNQQITFLLGLTCYVFVGIALLGLRHAVSPPVNWGKNRNKNNN